jgi:hypothetical protein
LEFAAFLVNRTRLQVRRGGRDCLKFDHLLTNLAMCFLLRSLPRAQMPFHAARIIGKEHRVSWQLMWLKLALCHRRSREVPVRTQSSHAEEMAKFRAALKDATGQQKFLPNARRACPGRHKESLSTAKAVTSARYNIAPSDSAMAASGMRRLPSVADEQTRLWRIHLVFNPTFAPYRPARFRAYTVRR